MENKNFKKANSQSGIIKVLLWGSSSVTLAFWTTFEDPFNPLKLSLILITSAWLIGHIVSSWKDFLSTPEIRNLTLVVISMLLVFLVAAGHTELKRTALLGDNQRYNGLLMYLGLCIILVTSSLVFSDKNYKHIFKTSSFLGFILAAYGLLQINGIDLVKWNNPYNAVISTVGNPNFAAAIMAIIASLVFGLALNNAFSNALRIFSLLTFLMLFSSIYLSDARQGLVGIAIGVLTILIVWTHSKNKYFGLSTLVLTLLGGILSILGMLQIGPLTSWLYKGSVTVRGYYWRAGIDMFQAHPWFGVGIDRYGAYFKQYREVGYPLNYGFDITSSNAHNVSIQFFATGGIFLGTLYLVLNGYIFWRGILGIKSKQDNERLAITAIFAAWVSYQATSFISIDNPGIAVWGWLLGGAVVGLSARREDTAIDPQIKARNIQPSIKLLQPLISISFMMIAVFLSSFLFKGEALMFKTRSIYNPTVAENAPYLRESAIKTINLPFINPIYKVTAANFLTNSGFVNEGIGELEKIVKKDHRNTDSLDLLATYYQQLGNIDLAIQKRQQIVLLDPWNAKNYLTLGQLYKISGDTENMKKMQEKILLFASSTPAGQKAKVELVP